GAPVAGQWMSDRERLGEIAEQTRARAGAVAPAVLDGAGGAVLLQPGGADRALEALPQLVERDGAQLVAHRPELRAVVRLEGSPRTFYAKVVRRSRLRRMLMTAWHLEDLAPRAFRIPDAIKADLRRGVITFAEMPGRALHERLAEADVDAMLRDTGAALRSLHDGQPPRHAPTHDAAAEVRVLRSWVEGVRELTDLDGAALAATAARVERLLLDDAPAPTATVHRDFHDKQILIRTKGRVGLLDFDQLASGEPELDVANMLAHLELRHLQDRCTAAGTDAAGAGFLEGYGSADLAGRRLRAYFEATRLRLACVYACRPRWRAVARAILERVDAPATGSLERALS
ncbi:MAG: phosphotransferase, partial [Planctomycetota bacterium]